MKHKLKLLLIFLIIAEVSISQSISPLESGEYCPSTNITFTVTLPRISDNTTPNVVSWTNNPIVVSGVANLTNTQTQTTFTFVGKFQDQNIKQEFKVNYVTDANPTATYIPSFKKIKSLHFNNGGSFSCPALHPNQSTITAPRCQITNNTISVNNIMWYTFGESPDYCFGTITTYEYQLPSGWSIGANVSNGTNWILGGNSVTVTSDLSNGVNGNILIRPANNCAAGLVNGYNSVPIGISRPAPTLTVTGTQDFICSGTTDFTINGMPSGSSVQWALSNTTDASISGCSTCSTVSVLRSTSANTIITLTATVTHCTFTYPVTHDISLGSPQPGPINVLLVDPVIGKIQVEVDPIPGATDFRWYKNGALQTIYHSTFAQIPITRDLCDVSYSISVKATTPCGTSALTYKDVYVDPSLCGGQFYKVSPNPASNSITISADDSKTEITQNKTFDEVKIYNLQGTLKKYQKFNKVQSAIINIAGLTTGTYFVEIITGSYTERHQFIIQK